MPIRIKQEISVHIKHFRNLATYVSGRYMLRVSLYTLQNHKKCLAIPINIVQMNPSTNQNQPITQDNYYMTKTFAIKSGVNIDIDQICLFRLDLEVEPYEIQISQIEVFLHAQLIQFQHNKSKISDQYLGKIHGIISDAILMDFYESCSGQIFGSVHNCILNYQYVKATQKSQKKKQKCQKQNAEQVQTIYKYLLSTSDDNLNKICQMLNQFSPNKKLKKAYSEQKLKITKALSYQQFQINESSENNDSEATQETDHDAQKQKRKRKPIFQSESLSNRTLGLRRKETKINQFQKYLHQNSLKIYQKWRELNAFLIKSQGQQFIKKKTHAYIAFIKQKVGQSVIRFKGSKDFDMFSNESHQRNMMVQQLRNQSKQYLKQTNLFSVSNQRFFTKSRPIFFQQTVQSNISQKNIQEKPELSLIILVHGLGACRLDMQKLRVELKRYHQDKIKVYISSSNESRTQGDIQAMGTRLASEVQSQIAKLKQNFKVSFIGHSMGGLIIRSALPRLEKHRHLFHSFITLSSPHVGYTYTSSKLVDAGLWFINTMKKCISIQQLTMQDSQKVQNTFIYKLSNQKGLQWFKKITFLASHQDSYVPFYSARVQKNPQTQKDYKKGFDRGIVYSQMIDNIVNRIKGSITRLDVNFCIPQQNIDNLIGRAAHICFINNVEMLRTFCIAQQNVIF